MNYRVLWGALMLGASALCMNVQAQSTSCALLIVGDSLSSGYGLARGTSWVDKLAAKLQTARPDWQLVNASVSGDTLQNGLLRLPSALQRHRPAGVVIELGGNDALRGTPPALVKKNLEAMVKQAQASGAWVAVIEPPVLPNYGKAYADSIARVYSEVERRYRLTRVPCFICGVGVDPSLMQADGMHPNARAQAAMLDAVWPYIQSRLVCGRHQ
jgi:acyl-CoA thioesterase-1